MREPAMGLRLLHAPACGGPKAAANESCGVQNGDGWSRGSPPGRRNKVRWMYADKTINCVGACQSPMLLIEEGMKGLDKGQILQVTADSNDLLEMVRSWTAESGHTVEEEYAASGVTTLLVRKGTAPAAKTV